MEYRYRQPGPNYSIWWQVALGVFLAMLAHSVVTGLYERREMRQAMAQLDAETKKLEAQASRQVQAAAAAARHPQYQYDPHPVLPKAPLRDGERCIQGRRFQRVDNGWVQLPKEPC